jgi:hypothetical protein
LIDRIRAEFIEMPGLTLTLPQAQRLWNVDATACQRMLDALVATHFLRITVTGTYARGTEGRGAARPHTVKANLRVPAARPSSDHKKLA